MVSPNLHAMLTVVVEVESGRRSGPEDSSSPTLLVGPTNLRLLQPGTLDTQEQSFTFDRVLGPDAAQEAEQELLARVQSTLGSVGRGYSVALLLRGRETEAPRLVPQLLQIVFEEALPLSCSDPVLSTLSLVQFSPTGRTQDLLSSGMENLSVLDVAPLGLVVEDATEVEVSDSKAASELYLQATAGEGRTCCLLTLIVSCPGPDPPEGPGTQGVWRGALRILQLPGAQTAPCCGCWLVKLLVRRRRALYHGLSHSFWEETTTVACFFAWTPKVVKAWSQHPRRKMLQGARTEAMRLPEPQQVIESPVSQSPCLEGEPQVAGRTATLRCGLHQKNPLRHPKEQQVPDVALQFFLAQARRQRLREQHQIWIREKLKHLEQKEEVADDQIKDLVTEEEVALNKEYVLSLKACKERQRWQQEQMVLRFQLEALQEERDTAEQDLAALYDLHVQATRAQTHHVLRVFRAWQGQWEERAMTTEHRHCSLLAGILEEAINLATQNQELLAQNQQLRQGAD
ncbi:uncharacterized protein LOC100429177 [Macaca mulatta]